MLYTKENDDSIPNTEQKKKKLKIHRFRLYQRHGQCHQHCNLYGSHTYPMICSFFSSFHYNLNVQYHNMQKEKKRKINLAKRFLFFLLKYSTKFRFIWKSNSIFFFRFVFYCSIHKAKRENKLYLNIYLLMIAWYILDRKNGTAVQWIFTLVLWTIVIHMSVTYTTNFFVFL